MIETDPQRRHYRAQDGEHVAVTVQARNTNQLVQYTLDGNTRNLPAGQSITFTVRRKPGNAATVLQLVMDYSGPSGGNYRVTVSDVSGYPNGESWRDWEQTGSLSVIKDYKFFV